MRRPRTDSAGHGVHDRRRRWVPVQISRLSSIPVDPMLSMGYKARKICPEQNRKTAASAMPASAPTGRPSTRQLAQLRAAGCSAGFTGRRRVAHSRPGASLLRLLKALAPGDVVTVTRIDRLARSYLRPVRHRQADRGRQGAIPVTGGTVGRHRHQHRAADDRRSRRAGGRGARPDPHPHGRRPRAGRRRAGSTWADRRSSPRSSRRKHGGGGPKGQRSRNWRRATTSGGRRFRG